MLMNGPLAMSFRLRLRKKINFIIPALILAILLFYFYSFKSLSDSSDLLISPSTRIIIDDSVTDTKHPGTSAEDVLKENNKGLNAIKPSIPGVGTSFNSLIESGVAHPPSKDGKKKLGADEDVYKDFLNGNSPPEPPKKEENPYDKSLNEDEAQVDKKAKQEHVDESNMAKTESTKTDKPLFDSKEDAKLDPLLKDNTKDTSLYSSEEDSKLDPNPKKADNKIDDNALYDPKEDSKLDPTSHDNEGKLKDPNALFDSVEDAKLDPSRIEEVESGTSLDTESQLLEDSETKPKQGGKLKSHLDTLHETFFNIFEILSDGKPSVSRLDTYANNKKIFHPGWDAVDEPVMSKEYLSSFLQVSPEDIASMKASHSYVVKNLPDAPPEGLYKGNGVVYVGGGKFNWLSLLSIKTLRALGSNLPVEVLIPKPEEYEKNICEKIFPSLNAKCIFLDELIDKRVQHTFKGYQYKVLAMLLSSFENVLLLDADNFPLKAPDALFTSEPFTSNELIAWPDFWKRTTSPAFYDITNIQIDENERIAFGWKEYGEKWNPNVPENGIIPLHHLKGAIPDPSCESGQLLISKNKHFKSLALALYYNLYGPDYFYPLFTQGADGEGDKETFVAAAHVLGKPFYQVKKFTRSMGRFVNGEYVGSAMAQSDPIEDYRLVLKYKGTEEEVKEKPTYHFLHANFPKLDPWSLKQSKVTYNPDNGERTRLYGLSGIDDLNFDLELLVWKSMKLYVCDLQMYFQHFEDQGVSRNDLCNEIKEQLEYLQSTSTNTELPSLME